MKNSIHSLFLLIAVLFCSISVEVNAATCGRSLTASGKTITANFETINGKYVITLMASGSDYFSLPSSNWWVNGVDWKTKATGAGTNTLVITLDSNPNLSSSGLSWYMNGNTSSAYNVWGHEMPSIDWSGTCTPPDTQNPVITNVEAQSTTQTSITVRVTATDNQTNDTGVASITVTRHGSTPSQTQNYSPAEASIYHDFVFSGLTAGTTYTFDVTVRDAAGNEATTSQNLTTQAAVVDNTPPTISSAAAENIKATTADIRVQATDNIGVTHVVIKNGEETIKDQAIGATTSLNQAFTLTGLTKNTTYNNIKVIVYDARPNGSNIYNVPSFTTKNTNTIYFVKSGTSATGGWGATPKVHYTGGWEASAWPGINMTNTGMTNCDNSQIWRAEIPDNTNVVVFNNGNSGSGNQTENKTPFANQYFNWERDTWYSPEGLYILGAGDKFGNWTRSNDFKFSTWSGSAPTSVTKTLRLNGSSYYQFKVQYFDCENEWWRGNTGTMESNNCTKWLMNEANNCQIHTGSTGNYIFTYDFTANKLSVTYPVPPVGCSGNGTASQQTRIDYTVTYAGGNMIFNVRSQNGDPVIECDLCYGKNQYSSATSRAMTISNGEATYSLPATGDLASGPLYFYFYYRNTNNGKSGTASSLSDGNRFTYNIGGCVLDEGESYILSASQASATTTSVTLNVSGIVNIDGVENPTTQYVVSTNGGDIWSSPLTASTNQITVTGLSANTVYTVLVKAYYNGEKSTNTKTVSARTSRESQCSGTGLKHFTQNGGTPVDFDLEYDSSTGNVTITVQPTSGSDNVTYLQVDYLPAYGGQTSVNSATFSAPAASVTFNPHSYNSGNVEGTDIYFRFLYSVNNSGTRWMTAENLSSGDAHILYYRLGDCPQETESDPPCMNSISANDITPSGTSVTVDVSADDGDQPAPTKFLVSTASTFATSTEYTAAAGAITITGLTPCSDYTYYIAAKDRSGNISTSNTAPSCRYKSITFTTTAPDGNLALGQTCGGTLTGNEGERPPRAFDGDKTGSTSYTTYTQDGNQTYLWVNLGTPQYVSSVRIYWGDNYSSDYEIQYSPDNSSYTTIFTQSSAPAHSNNASNYQDHVFAEPILTQYIRLHTNSTNWVRIYEMEVYGDGECYEEMDPPTMVSASFVSATANSATIAVSGTDAKGQAIRLFSDGTNTYTATEGRITITGLTSCYPYNKTLYAIDKNGTSSADNATVADRSKSVSFTTGAPSGNNMAENAATTAIDRTVYTPANLTDGNLGTRWSSGDTPKDTGRDWAQVDLGVVQLVDNVRIYWETACADDYEVLFSRDGTNYFSVYHQTSKPTSKGTVPTPVSDAQDHRLTCPFATRYIKIQANHHDTGHGLSIWELEVYGPGLCAGLSSIPEMDCAQLLSVGSFEADIAVAASDAETVEANMKYEVQLTSGEAGYKQLTAVYNFLPSHFTNSEIGHLTLGGLLPDVPYEAHIYAIDEASNKSTGYQIINFHTAAANGCTWSDTERGGCDGSGTWTEGYTITIENNTPNSTKFRITATALDNFTGIVAPYFFSVSNLSNPCGNRTEGPRLSDVAGKTRTYTADIDKSVMTSKLGFMLKFQYAAGGQIDTKVIPFDVTSECMPKFVIYHYDDAPTSTAVTSSDASSIAEPILYYRHFTPDAFEDVTFPFAIDSVRVYDTEDHQYYDLKAQYNDGSPHQGQFYLREFPNEGSNGASFTNSWEDGTNALPQKNTAYSIRFPNDYGYYANKYILFHGHPGDIATSLSLGTRPTTDDLYKVYPNPTMSAQNLGAKAYVTTDRSENLYWKEDNATVQAFETYVLANENTMKRMRRIAAWSEGDDTPTSIEDVRDAMAIHACIAVYSLTGQKIGEWHNCSFGDAEDAIALRGQKGCYILVSEGQTRKMIIQ